MLPLYWPKLALSESTDRYQEKIEPGVCYVDIKNSSFKFAILSKMHSHQHHLAASDKLQFAWMSDEISSIRETFTEIDCFNTIWWL